MTSNENGVGLKESGRYSAFEAMNPRNFFGELKRRHVYRVAFAYAVGGWALAQGIAQVFPVFDVPNWVIRLLVVLIVIGFPVALILAWAFELTPEGIKRTEDVDPVAEGHSRKRIWIYVVIIGGFVSIALFFLGRYTAGNKTESLDHISNKSIAVLPLLNESGDPGDEYFSDGLSEELIAAFAQIRGLKVIGRSSSFRFKDKKEDSKAIGEKLGVSTLLEGTVRKQGDQVRIVAELVKAADGSELWSRTFDRELKDIFAVQAEIAGAVATSLELTLLGTDDTSAKDTSTKNVEAHNAYLQGHFYFQRRNLEDYLKSVGFFDQATRLDPDYALAYAERSEAWAWIGDLSSEKQKEAWAAAASDAEKAVAIDSHLAEAHAALGWVRFFIEWKFAEGLAELRYAQQLSPWNPTANDLMARVVVYLGQFQEAERLARQAIELDPLGYQARTSLARVLLAEEKLDEMEASARKAAELQPTAAGNHRWLVFVAIQRGDGEAALHEARLEPNEGYRHFELALAHYARGNRPAAHAALADLIAKDRDFLAYQIAEVYAWRGETDKAFEWLEVAFNNHDTGMLSLSIDPLMRGLQHDARYKGLVAKIGLPVRL
jgi:TolB-like protein/tetratricopeptide (TPR) repeat protein